MPWLEQQWRAATEPTREDKFYAALEALIWSFNAGIVIRTFTAIWR